MGCCENGCFTHYSLLCLGWECGGSKSVCECICPGFGILRAPGLSRTQICCFSTTKIDNPDIDKEANVPLDIQCMSNLYICSFATGEYPRHMLGNRGNRDQRPGQSPLRSAPQPMRITRTKSIKEFPGVGKGSGVSGGTMMPSDTPETPASPATPARK